MIVAIQDVYYNVENMDRAVKFYRDILGLKVVDSNPYWTSLEIGGMRMGLHWTEGGPVPAVPRDDHGAHAGGTVTFRCEEIEKTHDALRSRGVKFLSGVTSNPWGKLAVFEDPDGNVLKLMAR